MTLLDVGPARVSCMKRTVLSILGACAAVCAVAFLAVFAWKGSWWLKEDSVNRSTKINQKSYGRQDALESAVLQQMVDYSSLEEGDQKTVIGTKMCIEIAKMTNPVSAIAQWGASNC